MTKDEIKQAIIDAFDERDTYGHAHSDHHRFIEEMIAERQMKRQRLERVRQQVIGWGIITLLSGIGVGTYHLFIEFINKASH